MSDDKNMKENKIQEYREGLKKIVEEMRSNKINNADEIKRYREQMDIIQKEMREKLQSQNNF